MLDSKSSPSRSRPLRLLLVNPRFPESFWSFRWAVDRVLPGEKRTLNPPLGLATLAALTPPEWDVRIVDENVESVPLEPDADVVGVCGMAVQFPRQRELLHYYRRRGHFVVAGGSFTSLCPERYRELAHTVVAGEAEYTWPRFCEDLDRGEPRPLYQESAVVDLADSPAPRFDLLQLDRYTNVSLQFSRGCPYRCEFCDIIVMFGRRPRTKCPEQIGRELDALRARDVRNVFFVDDNLIGHKAKAKELLRYLIEYQRRHRCTFQFGTETSLNLADDPELLSLFRQANFAWTFIGIESPDEASLKETRKTQNTRGDLLDAVHRIYRHGIDVLAGFIVGFDNDTMDTFERQYRFITRSGIQVAMAGLLTAIPKTPLYERLEREGRLIAEPDGDDDNTKAGTNFLPKQMGYAEMVEGYRALHRRLARDRCIAERIRNKTRHLTDPVYQAHYPLPGQARIMARFCWHGLLPGGPVRWYHFLRTLMVSPRVWPQVICDWIAGLALQDYVTRHFDAWRRQPQALRNALDSVRTSCAAGLRRGTLALTLHGGEAGPAEVAVTLRGRVDERFFSHGARRLEKLLRGSSARLSLRVEALSASQYPLLRAWMARLARYGDRVSVRINKDLRPFLAVDSSVFHLVLDEENPALGGQTPRAQ